MQQENVHSLPGLSLALKRPGKIFWVPPNAKNQLIRKTNQTSIMNAADLKYLVSIAVVLTPSFIYQAIFSLSNDGENVTEATNNTKKSARPYFMGFSNIVLLQVKIDDQELPI